MKQNCTTRLYNSHGNNNKEKMTMILKEKQKAKRVVTFDTTVSIRLYETILGDHPCATNGPPVALGWNYVPLQHEQIIEEGDNDDVEQRRHDSGDDESSEIITTTTP